MANPWGSYMGFGNLPGSTNYPTAAERDRQGLWENAWSAFLQPYLQQFGGTPFANRLREREGEIKGRFDAENARRMAETGDLLQQWRPDDWLYGLIPQQGGAPPNDRGPGVGTPPPRNGFDPLSWYMSQSPQQRSEGRQANPFTRWLSF